MASSVQHAATGTTASGRKDLNGGRFDFDDGGTYCGGWEDGKAHGHGVCTGPKGQGEYAGAWHYGFEVSGVYTWPSGSTYEGHWQNGKRHGLGVESRGRWVYRGEWTQGFKGRYGVRQSTVSSAKYEGTWANGLQDGYGSETYADGGTYQGQWLRGMRHGYGVRTSAPFGMASHNKLAENRMASMSSLNAPDGLDETKQPTGQQTPGGQPRGTGSEDGRGGFVLRSRSDEVPHRRRSLVERTGMKNFVQGLKLKKQRSTGDLDRKGVSIRSTGSTTSWMSSESGYTGASVVSEGSNQSFILEDDMLDASVTETYMGEWKNDKRSGFGISERSDGLKYEGEWYNNKKYGYGVTTQKDGTREEGKYKNNILITSNQKRHLFLIRSAKFRERIDSALNAAQRASKIALQKADIAISRTATARGKAEQADMAAVHSRDDAQAAIVCAKQYSADMDRQPGEAFKEMKPANNVSPPALSQPPSSLPSSVPSKPPSTGTNGTAARPAQPPPLMQQMSSPALGASKPPPMRTASTISSTSPYIEQQQQQQPTPQFKSQISAVFKPDPPPLDHSQQRMRKDNIVATEEHNKRIEPPPNRAPPPMRNSFSKPTNNCDIDNTSHLPNTDHRYVSAQPQLQPPKLEPQRGRTPTRPPFSRQEASEGGYNFQRIMDDHFEHYKRPASRQASRERSVDMMPAALSEARYSRPPSRPASRTRTPLEPPSDRKPVMDGHVVKGNGQVLNDPNNTIDDLASQVRYRGASQEISHFGSVPKRTESLYLKTPNQAPPSREPSTSGLQRKKSLPDVQNLMGVTKSQGSTAMTREEISILSSSRRDHVRRQLEEIERYKSNPFMYIFNPRLREWLSRQQLMILVLFVNLSLALMFFKLLT